MNTEDKLTLLQAINARIAIQRKAKEEIGRPILPLDLSDNASEEILDAYRENNLAELECLEVLHHLFITTQGYNEFLEAELAMQNEVL